MSKRIYPLLLFTLAALASAAVYDRLPRSMAVHWDLDGNPNGWMPRVAGAFFGPVFLLLIWGVMHLAGRAAPRIAADARASRAYESVVASVLMLILVCHGIVLAVAMGYPVPVGRVVPAFVGGMFVVMGRAMPQLPPNRWNGIRTPWTLADPRVWERTHRLAGTSMTAAGIAMIGAALLLPASLRMAVVLGATVTAVVGPSVYSYLTWRRTQSR